MVDDRKAEPSGAGLFACLLHHERDFFILARPVQSVFEGPPILMVPVLESPRSDQDPHGRPIGTLPLSNDAIGIED
ncbi:hypothetical protein AJ88_45635 [Mesorhizobium amorphae CCBAU 01583]|nr:hypothetical protein AJ88_45635 [Mesorhizobium amorphae CCBAU 01583]